MHSLVHGELPPAPWPPSFRFLSAPSLRGVLVCFCWLAGPSCDPAVCPHWAVFSVACREWPCPAEGAPVEGLGFSPSALPAPTCPALPEALLCPGGSSSAWLARVLGLPGAGVCLARAGVCFPHGDPGQPGGRIPLWTTHNPPLSAALWPGSEGHGGLAVGWLPPGGVLSLALQWPCAHGSIPRWTEEALQVQSPQGSRSAGAARWTQAVDAGTGPCRGALFIIFYGGRQALEMCLALFIKMPSHTYWAT